jgi:2-dehydropantoate 2-reductase
VTQVADLLAQAGFEVQRSPDIRRELWYKLWGNMTMNPVSALTGATADRILDDAELRTFCSAVMCEAALLGERIGCRIEQAPEDRHQLTRKLGAFKTSMLQDVQAGRPIELDALLGAVQEMAQRLRLPTPFLDALLGLTRVFARQQGLYPPAP